MTTVEFAAPRITKAERQMVDDLVVHTLEQVGAVLRRTQEITPDHLKHHISMNVVSGLTSIAILDWAFQLLKDHAAEDMPPPRKLLNVMHEHIVAANLEMLPQLIQALRARSEQG